MSISSFRFVCVLYLFISLFSEWRMRRLFGSCGRGGGKTVSNGTRPISSFYLAMRVSHTISKLYSLYFFPSYPMRTFPACHFRFFIYPNSKLSKTSFNRLTNLFVSDHKVDTKNGKMIKKNTSPTAYEVFPLFPKHQTPEKNICAKLHIPVKM